jgi:hypothetical protein
VQITTDGLRAYREAVGDAFHGQEIDFAQLHKVYGVDPRLRGSERRYSPPVCTSTQVTVVAGDPDPGEISTSYVERQNLTMRMGMRRFTPHKRVLEEGREPRARRQPALHALQLRAHPPDARMHARAGRRRDRQTVEADRHWRAA